MTFTPGHSIPHDPLPSLLPRGIQRKQSNSPVWDLRAVRLFPATWMERARLRAVDGEWHEPYPNVFYETAILLATLCPPHRAVALAENPEDHALRVYFLPRAAYPIAYSCKHNYNLSLEAMVAFTLKTLASEHEWMLRRSATGLADMVDLAYTRFVEAKPCRPNRPPP